MENLNNYLDEVKKKLDIPSDRQLAMKLGVRQQYVNDIRTFKQSPNDDFCIKLAELAGDHPEKVLILARTSKANEKSKSYWEKILKLVTAATFLLLFTLPSFVNASHFQKTSQTVYYVKSYNYKKGS